VEELLLLLLTVHRVSDVRQIEIVVHTAESLVLDPSHFKLILVKQCIAKSQHALTADGTNSFGMFSQFRSPCRLSSHYENAYIYINS
jgi:hypothetical protein